MINLLADIIARNKKSSNSSWRNLLIGIGDDSAAWKCRGLVQLATTDCLIQNVHFDLNISTWEELGWKSIAVNLSDIAAMGGIPQYVLVSLALPDDMEVECISGLYQGMVDIGNRFEVAIVGGNISAARDVMISITVMGVLKDKKALMRSAARVGEQVALTGYTGLSAAGLRMLSQNLSFDNETSRSLREAHLKPVPRVREGQALLRCGIKAAIDISDGLIADLSHICEASKVSAIIRQELVPIHSSLRTYFKDDCQQLALGGGEDYELLFTAPSSVIEKVNKALSCPITVIGEITRGMSGQVKLVDAAGNSIPLQRAGWEHFKSKA